MKRNTLHTGISGVILALAARPEGVSLRKGEIPGFTQKQVWNIVTYLRQKNSLHAIGPVGLRRYFVNAADAQRYAMTDAIKLGMAARLERDRLRRERDRLRNKANRAAKAGMRKAKEMPKPPKAKAKAKAAAAAKHPGRGKAITIGKPVVGVHIPNYTGQKWAKDKPIDGYVKGFKKTICPSPPAFGPAAKLLGVGA